MQSILYFAVRCEEEPCWGGTSCSLRVTVYQSSQMREGDKRLPFTVIRFDCSLEDFRALNGSVEIPVPYGSKEFIDRFYHEWRL